MKRLTSLLILFCLSPYSFAQEVPLYETITDNVPKIGITTEVYLGDRMLEQRTGDYRECITPKASYEEKAMGIHFYIRADSPLCKANADSKNYSANYVTAEGPNALQYEVIFRESKREAMELCWMNRKWSIKCVKNLEEDDVIKNERAFIYQKESFQQTIEYAGKSGNMLKFVYSEFTKGLARDAFNREFQVDLNEGNVLAFKGALIEIESATNINIRYKVIRNFRD